MAKQKPDDFLGGGPRFNTVGTDNSTPGSSTNDDTGPILIPSVGGAGAGRRALLIVAMILLVGALYYISARGLGGVVETHGKGGVSGNRPDVNPDTQAR